MLPAGTPATKPHLEAGFRRASRDAWHAVWRSPAVELWIESDVELVLRLVRVLDRVHRGDERRSLLAEARNLEHRLGLSPDSRSRLL